jgi:hypothetical protein
VQFVGTKKTLWRMVALRENKEEYCWIRNAPTIAAEVHLPMPHGKGDEK